MSKLDKRFIRKGEFIEFRDEIATITADREFQNRVAVRHPQSGDEAVPLDLLNSTVGTAIQSLELNLNFKNPVRVLADEDIVLAGLQEIDGVTLQEGDRVAVAGQTAGTENGIYVALSGEWVRAEDLPEGDDASSIFFLVQEGSNYGDSRFTVTNDAGLDVVGTDALEITQYYGAGDLKAGTAIQIQGLQVSVMPEEFLQGGAAAIDGDRLELGLSASNYIPTTDGTEAMATNEMAAHVKGIDNRLGEVNEVLSSLSKQDKLDEILLTDTHITEKRAALSATPTANNLVEVTAGGVRQTQVAGDFVLVEEANVTYISWDGKALSSMLLADDVITVAYPAVITT